MGARDPLLSPDWYRVAFMRPRLRSGIRVSRQSVRGATWYVLSDPTTGRHHRFNDIAYALIGSCDGEATLDEVWAARVEAAGDDAPSQDEAIRVVAQAFAANLFVGDVAPDAAAVVKAHARTQAQRRRAAINPLALRVPLWNPDAFLDAHRHRVAWLLSLGARLAMGLVILVGALLLLANAGAVSDFAHRELGSPRLLLLLWIAYPAIKLVHELAHAFTVKLHGGEVHEIGITLLFLTPVPYVDASASIAFADKRKRIDVAAAGIVVEAVLASIALGFWLALQPGLARDFAFAVVFVGALSTLAVNGNPLLRFDGYHVLCDAAELPNLAQRSGAYWKYLAKRRLLGLKRARFGECARGERPWLLAYAPVSWLCRGVLLGVLAVTLAQWSAALGVGVLLLGLWMMFGQPAWAALRWAVQSAEVRGRRPQAAAAVLAAGAVAGLLAFGVPLPQRSHAPAVVWLPDDAIVRLASDGFLDGYLVRDGESVTVGTPIARLTNENLLVEAAQVAAQHERKTVERAGQFELSAQRAAELDDELARLAAQRAMLDRRVDALTVRAAVAGRVAIDAQRVRPGQYVAQGELIAHVLPAGAPLVRALVRNEDIALVREAPGEIRVALAPSDGATRRGVLAGAVPRATNTLPTPALGETQGGPIALDASDPSGRTAREPRFQIDLRLEGATAAPVGARAMVTFSHGEASAAEWLARAVRQSFLRWFER